MATAFLYHRVSSNAQETKEQVRGNRQYAEESGIKVLTEYGDFGKRHHAHKRPNFQRMLADIATMKPDMILVHRLDRFGVKDANELGYFLTILEQSNVRLITTIDGQDHSRDDIATSLRTPSPQAKAARNKSTRQIGCWAASGTPQARASISAASI